MAVKLERLDGQVVILPITMRIEGIDFNATVPTVKVEGHDGAIVDPNDVRLDERQIVISGLYAPAADTPEALALELQALRAFLASPYPYKVFVDEGDTQYHVGTKQRMAAPFIQGTGRRQARVTITYVCADPFIYAAELSQVDQHVNAALFPFDVTNPGTAPARPQIRIVGYGDGVLNPQLRNTVSGHLFRLSGVVQANQILLVDPVKMTATINGTTVLGGVNEEFLTDGFLLAQGTQRLEFSDDASGGHQADVRLVFQARYY